MTKAAAYTLTPDEATFVEATKEDLCNRVKAPDTIEWDSERTCRPSPGLPVYWMVNGVRPSLTSRENMRFCVSCEHTGHVAHKPGTEPSDNIYVWDGPSRVKVTVL